MTTPDTLLARGLGRLARRTRPSRPLHLVVADAIRAHPGLSAADVRAGWYAERAEQIEDATTIGGGL